VVAQYQTEIPVPQCADGVSHSMWEMPELSTASTSRHPRQTSDAIGGASSNWDQELWPGHAAEQGMGLPYGKTQPYGTSFRIAGESGRVVPGHGTGGRKAEPTYDALIEQSVAAPV